MAFIEHVNVTVKDPKVTAQMLCDVFGWKIRWEGEAINGGYTIHVGTDTHYLAVYSGPDHSKKGQPIDTYITPGGLNHVGIVVPDLDAVEVKVKAKGYVPGSHQDYEPGRRFYFTEENGVEIEVVCYD
ncbi:VOC family protein [Aestuariibius sp. HNIBRBA575]|uniref:VOC family protein n=1 Tax=Aestuariibius sp. HNIBRBA575 TaxID=3233343 RepID=UPI0034A55292